MVTYWYLTASQSGDVEQSQFIHGSIPHGLQLRNAWENRATSASVTCLAWAMWDKTTVPFQSLNKLSRPLVSRVSRLQDTGTGKIRWIVSSHCDCAHLRHISVELGADFDSDDIVSWRTVPKAVECSTNAMPRIFQCVTTPGLLLESGNICLQEWSGSSLYPAESIN